MSKIDADARAMARRYTTKMLNMLRKGEPLPPVDPESLSQPVKKIVSTGYARTLSSSVVSQDHTAQVAEAATIYTQRQALPASRSPQVPPDPLHHGTASLPCSRTPVAPTVSQILGKKSGTLAALLAHADELSKRNAVFRAYLPEYLHDHAMLVNLDEQSWIIHTDTAGWATRLRYVLHSIQQTLSQHLGFPVPKPRIRIKPIVSLPPVCRARLTLTQKNAKLLEQAASAVCHLRLKEALHRLVEHGYHPDEKR